MKKIMTLTSLSLFLLFTNSGNLYSQQISDSNESLNGDSTKKIQIASKPFLDFGDAYKNGIFNFEEFKKLDSLKVSMAHSDKNASNSFQVMSYKFMFLGKNTGGPKFIVMGSSSLKVLKSYLEILEEGDLLQFSDVQVKNSRGEIVQIDNFSAKISGLKK